MIALRVIRRPGSTEPDPTPLVLPPEGLTIGRAVDCGLVLADPVRRVSREHAHVAADGQAVRVRCVSASAPLWVNDVQLDPGRERGLAVGDRLRIGGFELAVEPVASVAEQRSRLDRWFDLDGVPEPFAGEPEPGEARDEIAAAAEVAAPAVQAAPAVVSWQASPHVVRTAPVPALAPPLPPPEPPRGPAAADRVEPAPPQPVRFPDGEPADLRELAAAFARGAGLAGPVPAPTPEWMEHLGALLRATAEGTLAMLQSRAVTKRHMRAEGTHIAPRQNNPLKFSPDAAEALTRMLQPQPSPGFLDPVAALRDAHRDLLVHQVAMVAGMRAAVFELFSRLGPAAAEQQEGAPRGLSHLPALRAAALWQRHCLLHAHLLEHLDDDFEAIFGREFLRAYEEQSRLAAGTPDATRQAAP